MTIEELLRDKTFKPKEKTEMISAWVLDGLLPVDELVAFAETQKEPAKASCIEAMEYATKQNPAIGNEMLFDFVAGSLLAKAPRVKWESAKVIANIASLYPERLSGAITNLLANTGHAGTVVRWSAAHALGEILKVTPNDEKLRFDLEVISAKEEKNSIKKIYLAALKKVGQK